MYTGYKEVTPSDFELNMFYNALDVNLFDCQINEYLMIKNLAGEVVDTYKWTGKEYSRLKFKDIDNLFSGKIHPRNPQQRMAFDLLQDEQTTVKILTGTFGSGMHILFCR